MKLKVAKLTALLLALLLCVTFASCGEDKSEEEQSIPVIDLELPTTTDSGDVYNPDAITSEPTTDVEPSTEGETSDGETTEVDPSTETTNPNGGGTTETSQALTTGTVNLREAPEDGKVITTVNEGVLVTVLDTSNTKWYKVSYNGQTGYISAEYLDTAAAGNVQTGKITASSLNIRETNDSDSKSLGTVTKGTSVTIIESSAGWHKIVYKDITGWVSGDYVEVGSN